MKIFILFAPKFREWPIAIIRSIRQDYPDASFLGLTTGKKRTYKILQASCGSDVDPLDWLDDLERSWLETPFDLELYKRYESRLGSDAIKRIIISDRHLGCGFVTGGEIPETPLVKLMGIMRTLNVILWGCWTIVSKHWRRQNRIWCFVMQ